MKKQTYRAGVPESEAAGPPDPNAVWRAFDKRTGGYLGVIAREAPSVADARRRAAQLYAVPEEHVGIRRER